jgi:hypothetical protein
MQGSLINWRHHQDREEKEKQLSSRAPVEEMPEDVRGVNSIGLEEEIIELQDLRMSPIPSLRNRHKAKYYKEPGGEEALPLLTALSDTSPPCRVGPELPSELPDAA